jgi:mannose-6-phosphate isomerase-like protein (cupin superfamily)
MTDDEPHRTLARADAPTVTAPDGSTVRVLLATDRGSVAQFELEPGRTSLAVRHRTVEEIWTVVEGRGEMWRRSWANESIVTLEPGTCLVIPTRTAFQFRTAGPGTLVVLAVTMPPWPGPDEAELVEGCPGW